MDTWVKAVFLIFVIFIAGLTLGMAISDSTTRCARHNSERVCININQDDGNTVYIKENP